MTITVEQLRFRLALLEKRKADFEQQARNNGGQIKRHESWRHEYLSFPYLLGAPDERIWARFRDVFINTTELNNDAKVVPLPVEPPDSFAHKFTHLLEELGARGGLPIQMVEDARRPVLRYFENGDPIAVKIFEGYEPPEKPFLVKYGKREFLEPMLTSGRLRICPASFYNNVQFDDAIKDDEIHRPFFIPTYRERLNGVHYLDFQGHRIQFGDDDITLPIMMPDYFLFSLCDHIYYRMPTDFGADAALIIRDPNLFIQRLISAFLARWPDWRPRHGPVVYYDPYRDYSKVRIPEMSKHFGYAYQREVRVVLQGKTFSEVALEPEFLEIGSMEDYSDLVWA